MLPVINSERGLTSNSAMCNVQQMFTHKLPQINCNGDYAHGGDIGIRQSGMTMGDTSFYIKRFLLSSSYVCLGDETRQTLSLISFETRMFSWNFILEKRTVKIYIFSNERNQTFQN